MTFNKNYAKEPNTHCHWN